MKLEHTIVNTLPDEDARPWVNTRIPTRDLLMNIVYSTTTRVASFRSLDHKSRRLDHLVQASDSTLHMALNGELELEGVLTEVGTRLKEDGALSTTLPSGRSVRLACADGTNFGDHYFSALGLHGAVNILRALEQYSFGSELSASDRVLKQLPEFVTHLALDGLYASRLLQYRENHDLHPVVKLGEKQTEDNNRLLKKANFEHSQELVDTDREDHRVKHVFYTAAVEHTDKDGRSGEILVVKDVQMVEGKRGHWKPKQTRYYLTTDTSLTAADVYALTVARWSIETLFRDLNRLFDTKSAYVKCTAVKLNRVLLQALGLTLVQHYRFKHERELLSEARLFNPEELTLELVIELVDEHLRAPPG